MNFHRYCRLSLLAGALILATAATSGVGQGRAAGASTDTYDYTSTFAGSFSFKYNATDDLNQTASWAVNYGWNEVTQYQCTSEPQTCTTATKLTESGSSVISVPTPEAQPLGILYVPVDPVDETCKISASGTRTSDGTVGENYWEGTPIPVAVSWGIPAEADPSLGLAVTGTGTLCENRARGAFLPIFNQVAACVQNRLKLSSSVLTAVTGSQDLHPKDLPLNLSYGGSPTCTGSTQDLTNSAELSVHDTINVSPACPTSGTASDSPSSAAADSTVRSTRYFALGSTAQKEPGTSCGTYVALGDSFSTGQGGPPYPAGAPCYRSTQAYAVDYDPRALLDACSGATSATIKATQLGRLGDNTRMVSVTAGGDDAGLFELMEVCVLAGAFEHAGVPSCQTAVDGALHGYWGGVGLKKMEGNLVDLYESIHEKAQDAAIYVLGYPIPVPRIATDQCDSALKLKGLNGSLKLEESDADFLYSVLVTVNHFIHLAVNKADAKYNARVTYVPTASEFEGHDVCSRSSWFYPLSLTKIHLTKKGISYTADVRTWHPTEDGEKAMAAALQKFAGPPPS